MGPTISIRLQDKDYEEFVRRVEATGEKPGTLGRELIEKALREERVAEELRHRLETMEAKMEAMHEDLRSFGSAILMAVGSLGTDQKLTPNQVKAWLRSKGVGS